MDMINHGRRPAEVGIWTCITLVNSGYTSTETSGTSPASLTLCCLMRVAKCAAGMKTDVDPGSEVESLYRIHH